MLLKDEVAMITGGGSGIGRATARLFAQHGARVAVADFNDAGGRETVEQISADDGQAIFVHADIGKRQDIEDLVRQVVDRFGPVTVLFSNAASYATGAVDEISEEDWDRTLDVCLKATWRLARLVVPGMRAQGGGTIVITGSVHAIRGFPQYTAYQAAKGGLLALTRSLAADCAPTIRVNTILPGAVITGLWKHHSPQQRARIARMCPLQRNGQPEEIAQVALFLASDMSSYMTGASVVVDGGLTAVIQPPTDD